ncbi:hypothetical protein OsI_04533 [Oryza sativa Indica Group]|uniref:Uncharacterized protein n=1 Tax=Oryza sativa subsp. indica TaxID=39946 RepID=B8A710_ORYSI|nr:hypothetical protein OsI_04533 [Oryza sativa Indica Group]
MPPNGEGRSIASELGGIGSVAGGLGGGTRKGSGGEGEAPSVGGRGGGSADKEGVAEWRRRGEKTERKERKEGSSRRRKATDPSRAFEHEEEKHGESDTTAYGNPPPIEGPAAGAATASAG